MTYKTFDDIEFHYHRDGQHSIIKFDNNYGASVVRSFASSLGAEQGLYEIVVLDEKMNVTYETPICNRAIGFLTEEEVTEIMIEIQNLPPHTPTPTPTLTPTPTPTPILTNKIKFI